MEALAPNTFFDLETYRHARIFQGLAYPWQALPLIAGYLQTFKLGEILAQIDPGAYIVDRNRISLGKGTIVEPGAYIKGPCVIGENCVIRHGAYIRGDFICGDRCVIGHDTEVKNTMFLNGTHAAHFAYVGDSILGNKVNLGAGTKCANLKLDHSEVVLVIDGKVLQTGLRKFGSVLGDDCQIGCNAVLNPGTVFGREVLCYPSINTGGVIASRHLIKSNTHLVVRPRG